MTQQDLLEGSSGNVSGRGMSVFRPVAFTTQLGKNDCRWRWSLILMVDWDCLFNLIGADLFDHLNL